MSDHDDLIARLEELAATARAARDFANADTGSDLVAVDTDVAERRAALVAARAAGEHLRLDIEHRAAELADQVNAMVAAAKAQMEPLKHRLNVLSDGVRALDVYLGRDEDWLVVTEGDPAPEGTPITIRQRVLAMDEESLVAADKGGLTGRDVYQFVDWLRADPARVDQLLPEPKGIVGLRPRARPAHYKDPWESLTRHDEDVYPYLLVRNGERVYLYDVAAGVHHWGDRLVPLRDEFTAMFTVTDRLSGETRRLEPGTRGWADAEKAAGARQRHYMTTALCLQGIIDRTTVLHPLPDGVSVVNPDSYDAGHLAVVADADLTLADGMETYEQWRRRLLADLRPGMRVIFNGSNMYSKDLMVHPKHAGRPGAGPHEVVAVERGTYGDELFKIMFDRGDIWVGGHYDDNGRWVHGEYRPAKQRASMLFYRYDSFVVPFDSATIEDVDRLIANRGTRRQYLDAIPLLWSLRAALVAEQEAEQPFRMMLAGVLARDTGRTVAECEPHVADLVDWWKYKNRTHRPLVGDETANTAAVRAITAEYNRRLSDWAKPVDQRLVDRLAATPDCLVVARKRTGKYVTLHRTEGSAVFVTETEHGVRSGSGEPRPWLFARNRTAHWQVLWTSPEWENWPVWASPSTHLTGPELEQLTGDIIAAHDPPPAAVSYSPRRREFTAWLDLDDDGYMLVVEHEWERGDNGVQVRRRSEHARSDRWDTYGYGGDGYTVLHTNPDRIADIDARAEVLAAAKAEARTRSDLVDRQVAELRRQWREREEAVIYERFLADYGDAALWEQHRTDATLKVQNTNWPDGLDEAKALVAEAVDSGIEFSGLTVAELAVALGKAAPSEMAEFTLT